MEREREGGRNGEREGEREGGMQGGMQRRRDAGREGWREEGGKQGEREGWRDGWKDAGREGGMQGWREGDPGMRRSGAGAAEAMREPQRGSCSPKSGPAPLTLQRGDGFPHRHGALTSKLPQGDFQEENGDPS